MDFLAEHVQIIDATPRPTTPSPALAALSAKCAECGRIFDLLDETDAAEWGFGHDCEESGS